MRERIVVHVQGGLVQDVTFPDKCQYDVEVRDYDTEGSSDEPETEDGETFCRMIFESCGL